MEITNLLEFSHRAQLREWFEQHAASDKACWIAMYREKGVSFEDWGIRGEKETTVRFVTS